MKTIFKLFIIMITSTFILTVEVKAEPINTSFKDDAFYKCIIDSLNSENIDAISDRTDSYNATDSELSKLTKLNCEYKTGKSKIKDVTGLDKLITATYDILGLATYFTVGKDEVRAWTFKKGMNAKQCAGIIHTDFEKGFIRAEVMSYEDLIECGSELKVKEAGKARLEGKDYLMQDGDICHFRFNV